MSRVKLHYWNGEVVLPIGHGDILVGTGRGSCLMPRDDILEQLDLALKMAGPDETVERVRAEIAEDEDCAVITSELVPERSFRTPRIRA